MHAITLVKEEAMNLKDRGEGAHGRGWREGRKGGNLVIKLKSKKKKKEPELKISLCLLCALLTESLLVVPGDLQPWWPTGSGFGECQLKVRMRDPHSFQFF